MSMNIEEFFKWAQVLDGYRLSPGDIFWWSSRFEQGENKVILGLVLQNEQSLHEARIKAINLETGEFIEAELQIHSRIKGFKCDAR